MNMRFWRDHKWSVTMGGAGLTKALIDSSWVFTSIPLPGQSYSDVAGKIFYLLGEAIVTGFLYSSVGRILDSQNWQRPEAAEELLPVVHRPAM